MFIATTVEDWRIQGEQRVPNARTGGDFYILNTNRMYEITLDFECKCRLRFFDNPANRRDGGAWMKTCDKGIYSIVNAADTDIGSVAVTFDVYEDNDPANTTSELTIGKVAIAYVYPYGHNTNSEYCWVLYADDGWRMNRILVDGDYGDIMLLLEENPKP